MKWAASKACPNKQNEKKNTYFDVWVLEMYVPVLVFLSLGIMKRYIVTILFCLATLLSFSYVDAK